MTKQIGKECSIKATFRFHLQQKKTPRDMTKERGTMYKPIQVQKPHSKFSSNMKPNHAISWRIGIRHEPRGRNTLHAQTRTHTPTATHTRAYILSHRTEGSGKQLVAVTTRRENDTTGERKIRETKNQKKKQRFTV